MVWHRFVRVVLISGGCMLLAAGLVSARAAEPMVPSPPPTFIVPQGDPTSGAIVPYPPLPPGIMPQVFWQKGDEPQEIIKPSDHWVGLQCSKTEPALAAQLGLEEGKGVLVQAVVENSPGAKAGIEKYDVLVRAGDRELTKVQDLIDEVDKVKEAKLSIELIRKGEKKTVEITPEKRPPAQPLPDEAVDGSSEEWKDFFDYMKKWQPGEDGRPSMKFRFWRQPGTILPNPPDELPGNVKVLIRKEGDKPAQIEVTRGKESWSVNENELDKLPPDLRPHIERMLGTSRGPAGRWRYSPEGFRLPDEMQHWQSMIEKRFEEMNQRIDKLPNPLEGKGGILEKRFEDMNRRLDKLRESIDELHNKGPEKPKDELKDKPKVPSQSKNQPKAEAELKDVPKAEAEPQAPQPGSSGTEA